NYTRAANARLLELETQLKDVLNPNVKEISFLPESFCSLIFYPAAQNYASGHLLILGLGSGAGIIALLSAFENLSIHVVEKFEEVIELATKHFPLLVFFVKEGRLKIICDDGLAYVNSQSNLSAIPIYDAICLDMYSGDQEFSFSLNDQDLVSIKAISHSVWMNFIGVYESQSYDQLIQSFHKVGIDFSYLSSLLEGFSRIKESSNLLLSTQDYGNLMSLKGPSSFHLDLLNENLELIVKNKISI
ncbi:hypothetical protein MJH12_13630, partial [bacterium]|nr:hypothetical protein [bacterium]